MSNRTKASQQVYRLSDAARTALALWATKQSPQGFSSRIRQLVKEFDNDFEMLKVSAGIGGVNVRNAKTPEDVRRALLQKAGLAL